MAFEAGKPLEICDVDLEGPKEGEVLVELKATGVCHTDAFTLSGQDPEYIPIENISKIIKSITENNSIILGNEINIPFKLNQDIVFNKPNGLSIFLIIVSLSL